MPRVDVINETRVDVTPRVMQMAGMFDVPLADKSRVEFSVDLPLDDKEWNIGLIVGPSGAGKSSLARKVWGDRVVTGFDWPPGRCVLDGFPDQLGIKQVTGLLTAVGFGSPPAWVRPFGCLSTGEQFRVTVARALADPGLVVIDEFTSVVDRRVAQVASHTIAKTVRRDQRQLVAVTCHFDVIDWLQPDWVCTPGDQGFSWRSLQRRPPLELKITALPRSAWSLFRQHHYLSGDLASGARCFGGWVDEELVAFAAYIHFPHSRTRNLKMGHRTVVLPDYQGLGIGGRLDDWIGDHLYRLGFRYRNVVAHPAMIVYYQRSPRWRLCAAPRTGAHLSSGSSPEMAKKMKNMKEQFHLDPRRLGTWSFEYVPPREQV